jgi:hypothetical protein
LRNADVNGSSDWNQNESPQKPEQIVARNVAYPTDEFGHEGSPRGDVEMKKSLMATVAAVALIAGASMASAAEGAKDQPGMKAGAAVKAEPEMKRGSDIKAGAEMKGKAETTGAGVETKSEMKSEPKAEMKAEPKADMKADSKTNADKAKPATTGQASEQKGAPAAKSAADQKTNPASKSSAEEKSAPAKSNAESAPAAKTANDKAAAPAANSSAQGTTTSTTTTLTTEQKTKIRTTVLQSSSAPKVSRSSINFNISVGTVVPRTVRFVSVPSTIVEIHPEWRSYSYFIVDEEIIIIEPSTFKIIAILNV